MEEKNTGKRLAKDGGEVRRGRKGPIVAGVLVAGVAISILTFGVASLF